MTPATFVSGSRRYSNSAKRVKSKGTGGPGDAAAGSGEVGQTPPGVVRARPLCPADWQSWFAVYASWGICSITHRKPSASPPDDRLVIVASFRPRIGCTQLGLSFAK